MTCAIPGAAKQLVLLVAFEAVAACSAAPDHHAGAAASTGANQEIHPMDILTDHQ